MVRHDTGPDWIFISGVALGFASLGLMALTAATIVLR